MKVVFAPRHYQPSGTMSFRTWTNPDLQDTLRQVFQESPREEIVEVIIERKGITAIFQRRKE